MREEFAIIKLPEHVKLPDNDSIPLMCEFKLCQVLLATHVALSDILLPCHSITRTMKLRPSAHPGFLEPSELPCKSVPMIALTERYLLWGG